MLADPLAGVWDSKTRRSGAAARAAGSSQGLRRDGPRSMFLIGSRGGNVGGPRGYPENTSTTRSRSSYVPPAECLAAGAPHGTQAITDLSATICAVVTRDRYTQPFRDEPCNECGEGASPASGLSRHVSQSPVVRVTCVASPASGLYLKARLSVAGRARSIRGIASERPVKARLSVAGRACNRRGVTYVAS